MNRFKQRGKQKGKAPGNTGKAKFTWTSNAPDHWPALATLERPDAEANIWMISLEIGATLVKLFEAANRGCELKALARSRLTPTGILDIPFEVEDNGERRAVFFFLENDAKTAARFNGIHKLLMERGEPEPVYFTPAPLPRTETVADPCRTFQADDLSAVETDLKGHCAMWWAADEGERFHDSVSQRKMLETFEALDGINTYLLAAIVRESGAGDEKMGRAQLPEEAIMIPMQGPEDQFLLFTASQEKGLRFHFPIQGTSPEYRDDFWRTFTDYANDWKQEALKREFPMDPPLEDSSPLGWFRSLCQVVAMREKEGETMNEIGVAFMGQ